MQDELPSYHYSDYGVEHRRWQSKTEATVLPSSDAQGLGRANSNLSSSIIQIECSRDVLEVQTLACMHAFMVYMDLCTINMAHTVFLVI